MRISSTKVGPKKADDFRRLVRASSNLSSAEQSLAVEAAAVKSTTVIARTPAPAEAHISRIEVTGIVAIRRISVKRIGAWRHVARAVRAVIRTVVIRRILLGIAFGIVPGAPISATAVIILLINRQKSLLALRGVH